MARMDAADKDVWLMLVEETQQALSTLRADDLEALAGRAENLLAKTRLATSQGGLIGKDARSGRDSSQSFEVVAARHRVLGDLLHATAGNLAVLERLRDAEGALRWER